MGSNYEAAPATKMLATHCICCKRPLVDAISVEAGMGPECRKHFQVPESATDNQRRAANALVHGLAVGTQDVASALVELQAMGFSKLVARLEKALVRVRIIEDQGFLVVHTPFSEAVVSDFRAIKGRRWNATAKANSVPVTEKAALFSLLRKNFAGTVAVGPKGPFTIPSL